MKSVNQTSRSTSPQSSGSEEKKSSDHVEVLVEQNNQIDKRKKDVKRSQGWKDKVQSTSE